jgi:hypothetical protein
MLLGSLSFRVKEEDDPVLVDRLVRELPPDDAKELAVVDSSDVKGLSSNKL